MTTCVRVLARVDLLVEERSRGRIVDDDVLDDDTPHEDVDAGLAEGRGGFHVRRRTLRAPSDRTGR